MLIVMLENNSTQMLYNSTYKQPIDNIVFEFSALWMYSWITHSFLGEQKKVLDTWNFQSWGPTLTTLEKVFLKNNLWFLCDFKKVILDLDGNVMKSACLFITDRILNR